MIIRFKAKIFLLSTISNAIWCSKEEKKDMVSYDVS